MKAFFFFSHHCSSKESISSSVFRDMPNGDKHETRKLAHALSSLPLFLLEFRDFGNV